MKATQNTTYQPRATGRRPPRGPPGADLERQGGRGRPSRHMWARAGCAGVGGRSTRAITEGDGPLGWAVATALMDESVSREPFEPISNGTPP